jgi:Arylsulfotransferase (ASST)
VRHSLDRHVRRAVVVTLIVAAAAWLALAAPAVAATPVSVFPIPGSRHNQPGTQIAFRGIPAAALGPIQVVGSRTGAHSGQIAGDSDGDGGSFLPSTPFAAGETVTVTTQLAVVGGAGGRFSFTIGYPAAPLPPQVPTHISAGAHGLQYFRSRPDLQPPSITVGRHSEPAALGDIFVAPQFGPNQNGPMILDPDGKLIWFDPTPLSANTLITDFRVQNLYGQPVLTWWQGITNAGTGRGVGIIFNSNYQGIAIVRAGNGLAADLHEFLITPSGQAYLLAIAPAWLHGMKRPVVDSVVQEIDISTGLVLFDWHALDHIPLSQSYTFDPHVTGHVLDPFHLNSISIDRDGNLVVSARNTSAVYKINRGTGRIMWTLGGKKSSFKMGAGTTTAFQHNAVVQPDGTLTIFDDGGGPPRVHKFSRAIRVALNTKKMTASLVKAYNHPPPIASAFEGGAQVLPSGDTFVGWGQQPYFTEFNATGHADFDAHFTVPTSSYRAYRFPWSGQPLTAPALAASAGADGSARLYASWNGATNVASWRVLAGPNPAALGTIGGSPRRNFETAIAAHNGNPDFAVQAIASNGQALGTSPTVTLPGRLAIYGANAFVPPSNGFGGLPVGCLKSTQCNLIITVRQGRTLLARSAKEYIGANQNGIVFFRLSPSARRSLSRNHRLAVSVNLQDVGGPSAATAMTLVAFSVRGPGPHLSVSNTNTLAIVGETEFVSSTGSGRILAECATATPCHVTATVSVGKTTIATTGSEFIGANELGYVGFQLSGRGKSMIAHARGHQLGAHVTITGDGATASADVALIPFR